MLREMLPGATIGLFLHSPFPSSEFFRCLPRESVMSFVPVGAASKLNLLPLSAEGREAILDGMLGANLVSDSYWRRPSQSSSSLINFSNSWFIFSAAFRLGDASKFGTRSAWLTARL